MRHGVHIRLDFLDEPALLQPFDDLLAGDEAVETVQFPNCLFKLRTRIDTLGEVRISLKQELAFRREHIDHRQRVALAHLEVVEVVRGRDLHRA